MYHEWLERDLARSCSGIGASARFADSEIEITDVKGEATLVGGADYFAGGLCGITGRNESHKAQEQTKTQRVHVGKLPSTFVVPISQLRRKRDHRPCFTKGRRNIARSMRQYLCAKSHARNLAAASEIHEAQSWRLDGETEAEEEGRWLAGSLFLR